MWRIIGFGLWWCVAAPLAAQWSLGVEVATHRFGGSSTETGAPGDPASFRPSRATTYALLVERRVGAGGVALRAAYGTSGIREEDASAAFDLKDQMTLYEVGVDALVALAHPGPGGAFLLHLGPLLDHWSVEDQDARTRLGGRAGLSLDWPIGGPWTATFQAGLAVTPSVFTGRELPDGFERRATWRRSCSAGLTLRL